ncbi:MAG: glycosyltransferase [Pseudomonadota bacterium]
MPIPKIIHQTWKTSDVPTEFGNPESWKLQNPDWDYILWTDEMASEFVAKTFPDLYDLYVSYPFNVQRADLFRYCVISKMGGLYADIDTDCLAPISPITEDDRLIVCEEPHARGDNMIQVRGRLSLQFNGIFAAPPNHPFWPTLFSRMRNVSERVRTREVLDSTGPCIFTAALEQFPDQMAIAYHSSHLFNPLTASGVRDPRPPFGDYSDHCFASHNWAGSWWTHKLPKPLPAIHSALWKLRAKYIQRREEPAIKRSRRLDLHKLYSAVPDRKAIPSIVILVPIRNAAPYLEAHWDLLSKLDYPRDKLRLVYAEGGSNDDTLTQLQNFASQNPLRLKEIVVDDKAPFIRLSRKARSLPKHQLRRRRTLAQARNRAIEIGLADDDDWVLWLDADVIDAPADVLKRLLSERAKIVTPNCVKEYGGPSFDMNAFFNTMGDMGDYRASDIYRRLSQPRAKTSRRLHLSDLNYLDRIELSSVGGTMLLVDANVHRAGLIFPEEPYRFLIETEAFGRQAKDLGITPIGLPNVEILHAKD